MKRKMALLILVLTMALAAFAGVAVADGGVKPMCGGGILNPC